MNRNYSPRLSGWVIVLLSAAVLAGCGRKSGLDLPPNASSRADTAAASATATADTEAEQAAKPSVFNPYYGTDAPPTAPKGSKKSFFLDPLLRSD